MKYVTMVVSIIVMMAIGIGLFFSVVWLDQTMGPFLSYTQCGVHPVPDQGSAAWWFIMAASCGVPFWVWTRWLEGDIPR